MRKDLEEIRWQLSEIAEKEATKLYRLAWRMEAHGCDPENVRRCRDEARWLHLTGYPEKLLSRFKQWDYAFKF